MGSQKWTNEAVTGCSNRIFYIWKWLRRFCSKWCGRNKRLVLL